MDQPLHPVRAYRLAQEPKLSLKALADRVGTSKGNLSRIENGQQPISEELLPKLAAETGIAPAELRPDLVELLKLKEGVQ